MKIEARSTRSQKKEYEWLCIGKAASAEDHICI